MKIMKRKGLCIVLFLGGLLPHLSTHANYDLSFLREPTSAGQVAPTPLNLYLELRPPQAYRTSPISALSTPSLESPSLWSQLSSWGQQTFQSLGLSQNIASSQSIPNLSGPLETANSSPLSTSPSTSSFPQQAGLLSVDTSVVPASTLFPKTSLFSGVPGLTPAVNSDKAPGNAEAFSATQTKAWVSPLAYTPLARSQGELTNISLSNNVFARNLDPVDYSATPSSPTSVREENDPMLLADLAASALNSGPVPEQTLGGVTVGGEAVLSPPPTTASAAAELANKTPELGTETASSETPKEAPTPKEKTDPKPKTDADKKKDPQKETKTEKKEGPSEPDRRCDNPETEIANLTGGKSAPESCLKNTAFLEKLQESRETLATIQSRDCSNHQYQFADKGDQSFTLRGFTQRTPSLCLNLESIRKGGRSVPSQELAWFKSRKGLSAKPSVDCSNKPNDSGCCLQRAEQIAGIDAYLETHKTAAEMAIFCKLYENLLDEENLRKHRAGTPRI